MKTKHPITQKDIALEAGVSSTAVSFFLNGRAEEKRLSPESCRRIEKTVAKYNYKPNFHARAMLNRKTYLAGVVMQDVTASFWPQLLDGIADALEVEGYHLIFGNTKANRDSEAGNFSFMKEKGVDGFIYAPLMDEKSRCSTRPCRIAGDKPVISILHPVSGINSVYTDHLAGGRTAAECLYQAGHRRVAYIGEVTKELKARIDCRFLGFRDYYREAGLDVEVFQTPDEFMQKCRSFTGVFCYSGTTKKILTLYKQLAEHGVRIPEDLSVIDYGEDEIAHLLTPKPVTLQEHKREIGRRAGALLMDILFERENPADRNDELEPLFIPGDSVCSIC